jgi:hypothetical protein
MSPSIWTSLLQRPPSRSLVSSTRRDARLHARAFSAVMAEARSRAHIPTTWCGGLPAEWRMRHSGVCWGASARGAARVVRQMCVSVVCATTFAPRVHRLREFRVVCATCASFAPRVRHLRHVCATCPPTGRRGRSAARRRRTCVPRSAVSLHPCRLPGAADDRDGTSRRRARGINSRTRRTPGL